jgi:hypothetical protein
MQSVEAPPQRSDHRDATTPGSSRSSPWAPPPRAARVTETAWTAVVWVAALAVSISVVRHQGTLGLDDAYIYFRHARNFADGLGWTYNPGHAGVDAATSPLYVLILAAFAKLGVDLVRAGDLLFVGGMTLCACTTHAFLARLRHWWAGAAAALLMVASPYLGITRGVESAVFLAAVAIALYLWVAKHDVALGIALALVVLARPDGVILVPLVIGAKWIVDRRAPIRTMVAGAAVAVAWTVFALLVVKHVFADTLAAKIAQGKSGLWFGLDYFGGLKDIPKQLGHVDGIAMGLAVVGIVVVAVWFRDLRWTLGVLLVFTLVQMTVYTVLGVPPYRWYYALPMYCAAVFAGVTLEGIGTVSSRWWRPLAVLPVVAVVVLVAVGVSKAPTSLVPPRSQYAAAARWINEHTPRDATVAATEIGILGYHTDRTVIDYLGLTEKSAIAPLERGDMTWWVNHLAPDYWVTQSFGQFEGPVQSAPWFHDVFHEVYRNGLVTVYQRVGRAPV